MNTFSLIFGLTDECGNAKSKAEEIANHINSSIMEVMSIKFIHNKFKGYDKTCEIELIISDIHKALINIRELFDDDLVIYGSYMNAISPKTDIDNMI